MLNNLCPIALSLFLSSLLLLGCSVSHNVDKDPELDKIINNAPVVLMTWTQFRSSELDNPYTVEYFINGESIGVGREAIQRLRRKIEGNNLGATKEIWMYPVPSIGHTGAWPGRPSSDSLEHKYQNKFDIIDIDHEAPFMYLTQWPYVRGSLRECMFSDLQASANSMGVTLRGWADHPRKTKEAVLAVIESIHQRRLGDK